MTSFQRKSATLKRHLQRFHKNFYEMPNEANKSSQPIVDIEDHPVPFSVNPESPIKVKKVKKEKSEKKIVRIQRRDPVYNLFTFNDDPNIAKCEQENCSAKLVVSFNRKSFSKQ